MNYAMLGLLIFAVGITSINSVKISTDKPIKQKPKNTEKIQSSAASNDMSLPSAMEEEHQFHIDSQVTSNQTHQSPVSYNSNNQMQQNDTAKSSAPNIAVPAPPNMTSISDSKKIKIKLKPMTKEEKETCLNAHNIVREYHGAAPLEWDDDLAKAAKDWAEKLMQMNLIENDPDLNKTGQGENVFMYYGPRPKKCADAVLQCMLNIRIGQWTTEQWQIEIAKTFALRYKEEPDYNYFKGRGKKKTKPFKHFTQVVWADTKKVGVGIARKFFLQNYGINYYITYVVARYFDRGNVEDKFIINVMPLKPEIPMPELHELDASLCKDAVGKKICNYYEKQFNIKCKSNSWETFMMDACYKKCSKCKV